MMVNQHLDPCLAKDFDANTIKPYRKKINDFIGQNEFSYDS